LRPIPIPSRSVSGGVTIAELCEQFLYSKRVQMDAGELGQISYGRYVATTERLGRHFGEDTPIEALTPLDFTRLRASLPATWGPKVLGSEIQSCRSIFKYAYEAALIDSQVRFGPNFRKPKAIVFRRIRREKGLMMFEAAEIRQMLDAATPTLRAMIMLGVNCGFGNSDC